LCDLAAGVLPVIEQHGVESAGDAMRPILFRFPL
jgi:hypothetical protein